MGLCLDQIGQNKAGYDPRVRGWYKQAKAENKPIYTDPYMAASLNAMVITFAAPIKILELLV